MATSGAGQLRRREREHPRDIEGDVTVADNDRARLREVVGAVGVVRVAVVPGHEIDRRHAAGQVFTGDAERSVGGGPDRVDDGVVGAGELRRADVAPEFDVAEEAGSRAAGAVRSKTRETDLIFGWSGATPKRTSPQGVRRRS